MSSRLLYGGTVVDTGSFASLTNVIRRQYRSPPQTEEERKKQEALDILWAIGQEEERKKQEALQRLWAIAQEEEARKKALLDKLWADGQAQQAAANAKGDEDKKKKEEEEKKRLADLEAQQKIVDAAHSPHRWFWKAAFGSAALGIVDVFVPQQYHYYVIGGSICLAIFAGYELYQSYTNVLGLSGLFSELPFWPAGFVLAACLGLSYVGLANKYVIVIAILAAVTIAANIYVGVEDFVDDYSDSTLIGWLARLLGDAIGYKAKSRPVDPKKVEEKKKQDQQDFSADYQGWRGLGMSPAWSLTMASYCTIS